MRSVNRLCAGASDWVWLGAAAVTCALALGLDRMVLPR
jgi:ABC-type phosphate transport system auxiliary subunit